MVDYRTVESLVKPSDIDLTSSSDGIYVRRNVQEISTDDGTKYQYEEAFMSQNEYETYSKDLLVGQINDEDNTAEYEAYKEKLDTGVLYTNGKYYKPKWASIYSQKATEIKNMLELYSQLGGDTSAISSLTINVYDVTALPENAVAMTAKEIIELWLFLLTKQETLFNEYKQSLN